MYRKNKFEISGTTWDEEFELIDGSYSISSIQNYFEYIIKKYEAQIHKPPIQHRVTFKFKFGYSLEFLTLKTMKLIGSTEEKPTKKKNTQNV